MRISCRRHSNLDKASACGILSNNGMDASAGIQRVEPVFAVDPVVHRYVHGYVGHVHVKPLAFFEMDNRLFDDQLRYPDVVDLVFETHHGALNCRELEVLNQLHDLRRKPFDQVVRAFLRQPDAAAQDSTSAVPSLGVLADIEQGLLLLLLLRARLRLGNLRSRRWQLGVQPPFGRRPLQQAGGGVVRGVGGQRRRRCGRHAAGVASAE
mmetsp:Transcript_94952/g.307123  ORF Transcript_94952/g.307123 Transcript_94952/m.307123 type:complete len:209 (+) Transcript_94952:1309-1935(+)